MMKLDPQTEEILAPLLMLSHTQRLEYARVVRERGYPEFADAVERWAEARK